MKREPDELIDVRLHQALTDLIHSATKKVQGRKAKSRTELEGYARRVQFLMNKSGRQHNER
jgi:hypothetical protein